MRLVCKCMRFNKIILLYRFLWLWYVHFIHPICFLISSSRSQITGPIYSLHQISIIWYWDRNYIAHSHYQLKMLPAIEGCIFHSSGVSDSSWGPAFIQCMFLYAAYHTKPSSAINTRSPVCFVRTVRSRNVNAGTFFHFFFNLPLRHFNAYAWKSEFVVC